MVMPLDKTITEPVWKTITQAGSGDHNGVSPPPQSFSFWNCGIDRHAEWPKKDGSSNVQLRTDPPVCVLDKPNGSE